LCSTCAQPPGGGNCVLQWADLPNFREFDQHWQINTGQDLDFGLAHDRYRQVGWRTAKHIGENRDAFTAVDALDGVEDILAALLHIVVGTDSDCLDLTLGPNDMLQR
jgi:hypothetical protein